MTKEIWRKIKKEIDYKLLALKIIDSKMLWIFSVTLKDFGNNLIDIAYAY